MPPKRFSPDVTPVQGPVPVTLHGPPTVSALIALTGEEMHAGWFDIAGHHGGTIFIARHPSDMIHWMQSTYTSTSIAGFAVSESEDDGSGDTQESDHPSRPASRASDLEMDAPRPLKRLRRRLVRSPSRISVEPRMEHEASPLPSRQSTVALRQGVLGRPITKVSNKIRKRERVRQQMTANKQLSEEFVNDSNAESDREAAFRLENAPMFRFVGMQPCHDELTDRAVATMVRRAMAVGSARAFEDWKVVLEYWRSARTLQTVSKQPLPISSTASSLPDTQSQWSDTLSARTDANAAVQSFRKAFLQATTTEASGVLQAIADRHVLAQLYRAYEHAKRILSDEVGIVSTRGQGRTTIVKGRLFKAIYPDAQEANPAHLARITKRFDKQLEHGRKWFDIQERFGKGILALIPGSLVPRSWVEKLKRAHFDVWLNLIEHHNPNAVQVSRLLEQAVQDVLDGKSPPGHRLVLEGTDIEDINATAPPYLPGLLLEYFSDSECEGI